MILSYTVLNDFENCPRKAYHVRVVKDVKQEPTPEMANGIRVHEAFENRLKKGTPLPYDLDEFESFATKLVALQAKVEYMLGMTADGNGCDFFAKDVWFRGKADVAVRSKQRRESAWLLDWKTGKVRENPFELECQAMLLWANHPEVDYIEGNYYWLREARIGEKHVLTPVTSTQLRVVRLAGEMEQCEKEKHWPAKPNPLCGWCPVKQCEHNRSKQ